MLPSYKTVIQHTLSRLLQWRNQLGFCHDLSKEKSCKKAEVTLVVRIPIKISFIQSEIIGRLKLMEQK